MQEVPLENLFLCQPSSVPVYIVFHGLISVLYGGEQNLPYCEPYSQNFLTVSHIDIL